MKQIVPKESLVYFLIGKVGVCSANQLPLLISGCVSLFCFGVFYVYDLSSQQVYKKLGQTHLALMNFSWAMDLDPKGANNQIKEAIDKRYLPEDEGMVCSTCLSLVCPSDSPAPPCFCSG